MDVKNIDKKKKDLNAAKKTKNRQSGTTAIRISSELYELLREKAFHERTTIRQIADDILGEALKK